MTRSLRPLLPLALLLAPLPARAASAPPVKVGLRLGEYTHIGVNGSGQDGRLFVGGDLNFWLGQHFYLNPGVEIVFVDHGSYFTVPIDLTYRIPIGERRKGFVWLGGGPDIVSGSFSGYSHTDLSADIQGGIGIHAGRAEPWLGLKYIFGSSDWDGSGVLSFGIRF